MKRLGISKQIILIATLPALLVSAILSTHHIWDQFDDISASLNTYGKLIAKQISPAAEYAIYSGNMELIQSLINTIIKNDSVLRVQIYDKTDSVILDVSKLEDRTIKNSSILEHIIEEEKHIEFSEPIFSAQLPVDDIAKQALERSTEDKSIYIGKTVVTITTRYANNKKMEEIKHGSLITITILLLTVLIVMFISNAITKPIKSLTRTVKNIASGDLETRINSSATGEIGDLQSCINHMADELKHSQSNMENQLTDYTNELQQTMEELEIRNAELDITRSKAIYASNAKSEFLANMSHEIRTPLSGIIGFTELLRETKLTDQQKDYSGTIQKSSRNLLEIINDILDLAKIESGKTEISKSEFYLIDVIEDIINLLSPTALDKNVELFYRIDKNVPDFINSDPFRLHQILTNLISNAIKFTDNGYVYLQVTTGEFNNNKTSIKFTVSDTGIGMNSEDKRKLFKAFTQADTSITRRFGGTGLGLVISQKLTLLMKGEIGFDSKKGDGSTFWFIVPVTFTTKKHLKSELSNKRVAFISNNFIAKQTFTTLLNNCECRVNNHSIVDLNNLLSIEHENDAVILFLSRKEIKNKSIIETISKLNFSKPSFLIASTRSYRELRYLQQHVFDNAVFTSEKIEHIKQKLINTINKNIVDTEIGIPDNDSPNIIDWSNINVMVVDDNEVNLRLAEIILHKHKANVTTAISGVHAIDYATQNSFDIIFMDLHMPGIDGYETTVKIRKITAEKQPVIIAVTANALPQEKEKVIQSGMNGIIIKPVSDRILQRIINQWVLELPIQTPELNIQENNDSFDHDKIFSIELAKKFTGNNEELAYELFAMLRAELVAYKKAIVTAVKDNDLIKLLEQIHKLNGASRCCGTTELKQISSHIEKRLNQNKDLDLKKETDLLLTAINNVANYDLKSSIKKPQINQS